MAGTVSSAHHSGVRRLGVSQSGQLKNAVHLGYRQGR
jgi:hypothetical protein